MKQYKILGGLALGMLVFAPLGKSAITDALSLQDGAGDIISIDNTGAVTTSGTCTPARCSTTLVAGSNGSITFEGSIGSFSFTLDSGTDPLIEIAPELMDLTTKNIKTTAAGSLTITYSASGITGNTGFLLNDGGTQTGDATSADYSAFVGTTLIATTGALTGSSFGVTNLGSSVTSGAGPYTLKQVLDLKFSGAGTDSGDFSLSGVPEPASISLFGSVLLLSVGAIRRRTMRKA